MKFSAQISTEEFRFNDNATSCVTPVHFFESDSLSFTLEIRQGGGGGGGVGVGGGAIRGVRDLFSGHANRNIVEGKTERPSQITTESKTSMAQQKLLFSQPVTQETQAEDRIKRHKTSTVAQNNNAEIREKLQKEEELKRKLAMRKPSRKISREGDYLVVQDKIGIRTTQSGTMQIKEVRCKIGSQEYFALINNL